MAGGGQVVQACCGSLRGHAESLECLDPHPPRTMPPTLLQNALGEEADQIEFEVSSPGAERQLRLPGELPRFATLPMKVEYVEQQQQQPLPTSTSATAEVSSRQQGGSQHTAGDAAAGVETKILSYVDTVGGGCEATSADDVGGSGDAEGGPMVTRWRLADVRENKAKKGKGRTLNKKEREGIIEIPMRSLRSVRLHIDI